MEPIRKEFKSEKNSLTCVLEMSLCQVDVNGLDSSKERPEAMGII